MTAKLTMSCMYGQARVAALASGYVSAARANQRWCEAATVEEDEDLAVRREVLAYGIGERLADALFGRRAQRIDEAYLGRASVAGAPR